jgi:hypothetical protein
MILPTPQNGTTLVSLGWAQNLRGPCEIGSKICKKQPLLARIRDVRRSVRWVFPRRFPYRIIYRIEGDVVLIIAVIHAAQHDRRWKQRVGSL